MDGEHVAVEDDNNIDIVQDNNNNKHTLAINRGDYGDAHRSMNIGRGTTVAYRQDNGGGMDQYNYSRLRFFHPPLTHSRHRHHIGSIHDGSEVGKSRINAPARGSPRSALLGVKSDSSFVPGASAYSQVKGVPGRMNSTTRKVQKLSEQLRSIDDEVTELGKGIEKLSKIITQPSSSRKGENAAAAQVSSSSSGHRASGNHVHRMNVSEGINDYLEFDRSTRMEPGEEDSRVANTNRWWTGQVRKNASKREGSAQKKAKASIEDAFLETFHINHDSGLQHSQQQHQSQQRMPSRDNTSQVPSVSFSASMKPKPAHIANNAKISKEIASLRQAMMKAEESLKGRSVGGGGSKRDPDMLSERVHSEITRYKLETGRLHDRYMQQRTIETRNQLDAFIKSKKTQDTPRNDHSHDQKGERDQDMVNSSTNDPPENINGPRRGLANASRTGRSSSATRSFDEARIAFSTRKPQSLSPERSSSNSKGQLPAPSPSPPKSGGRTKHYRMRDENSESQFFAKARRDRAASMGSVPTSPPHNYQKHTQSTLTKQVNIAGYIPSYKLSLSNVPKFRNGIDGRAPFWLGRSLGLSHSIHAGPYAPLDPITDFFRISKKMPSLSSIPPPREISNIANAGSVNNSSDDESGRARMRIDT